MPGSRSARSVTNPGAGWRPSHPLSNWTVRSSLAARRAVADLEASGPLDALFVHTHVPATGLGAIMDRIPTVVSIDATPKQIDSLGASYKHQVQPGVVESAKWRIHAACFRRAAGLVTWSQWAADSLVDDYGAERDRIVVVPPGVTPSLWLRSEPRQAGSTVRVLFVGGDFERKGGPLLVEAVQRLRRDPALAAAGLDVELHLVTGADVTPGDGVHVYRGLTPNSPQLIELFHRCDVFALPTFGDCTPVVLAEAAFAGLPAIATDVGAIRESLVDGATGHLVEPTVDSIEHALQRLVTDADHRLRLGQAALAHATERMDAETNARRILDHLIEVAGTGRPEAPRIALTVSGVISPEVEDAIDAGIRPLADYVAMSRATGATLMDWSHLRANGSATTNAIRRLAGNSIGLAHHLFRNRSHIDAVITDGEQIGIPLAVMLRLVPGRRMRHIMIAHRITPAKKRNLIRFLGLSRHIDVVLVYSSSQLEVARRLFDRPGNRVERIDFMVDTRFFQSTRSIEMRTSTRRPVLCTAGREFRDYPTLIEAVRGLDVDVVIASASPWSKRSDNAGEVVQPDNVTVTAFTQRELRDQLDDSDILVLPLQETDFQAGITTILEGMAMERPVICTATEGQTDVVVDGVNGRYVPPGDPIALRKAIEELIGNPDDAIAMGKRGRELVEQRADVRNYALLFADILASELRS